MKISPWARSTLYVETSIQVTESLIAFVLSMLVYFRPGLSVQTFIYLMGQKQLEYLIYQLELSIDLRFINLDEYIKPVAFVVMVVAGLSSVVYILGMIVAKSDNIILAGLFFVLTLFMLFVFFVVIATFLWKTSAVKETLRPEFQKSLDHYAGDRSNNDSVSFVWNLMMITMQCCGVNNYQDFQKVKNWKSVYTKPNQTIELLTPLVCCKERTVPVNVTCAAKGTASEKNNWATHGCLDIITISITSNVLVIILLVLHFLPLLLIVFLAVFVLADLIVDSLIPL